VQLGVVGVPVRQEDSLVLQLSCSVRSSGALLDTEKVSLQVGRLWLRPESAIGHDGIHASEH